MDWSIKVCTKVALAHLAHIRCSTVQQKELQVFEVCNQVVCVELGQSGALNFMLRDIKCCFNSYVIAD
ncbi:MAG: hypothetical protein EBU98_05785 [Actinobacteria bacterium]|nr:hypothetical protein [Actinomycetota bacterium]NBP18146.1 hypothetical protein [Actinomycetota bacterium]NDC46393.1 hypothetical protein [Actinomycetota bacterium]NDE66792.1 hypothetical protein [Actinomycetota bacterium]